MQNWNNMNRSTSADTNQPQACDIYSFVYFNATL